jgi:hypothetical protein
VQWCKNVIIVGNQLDVTSRRSVITERGQAMADKYGCGFMETSAKFDIKINETFSWLATNLQSQNKRVILYIGISMGVVASLGLSFVAGMLFNRAKCACPKHFTNLK